MVSYNSLDDSLSINLTSNVEDFSFYIVASWSTGVKIYYPFTVKMFTVTLSQTLLTEVFHFKEDIYELDLMQFLSISDGV